jgi:hypothetical protein
MLRLPAKHRVRGQLRPVVAGDLKGLAAQRRGPIQLAGDVTAGKRAVDDQGQTLPAEVVDHHQHPKGAPIIQDIGGEVERPALVRPLRDRHRFTGAECALAAAAPPDRQPLLAIKSEQTLAVHHETLPPEQDQQSTGPDSGYYDRTLVNRVGKLELRVPQDRCDRFPTELFERYQRAEKALAAARAGIVGRRTRSIDLQGEGDYGGAAAVISAIKVKLDEGLPDDVATLEALLLAERAMAAKLAGQNEHLRAIVEELQRALFGRRL